MYGIYTYIYHKNQPNVGKYIPVPWILWEPPKAQVWITGSATCSKNEFRQALHVTITTGGMDQTTL